MHASDLAFEMAEKKHELSDAQVDLLIELWRNEEVLWLHSHPQHYNREEPPLH